MSPSDEREVVFGIRADLRAHADPERAPGMQRYMKSAMPYLGVRVPEVRRIVRGRTGPVDVEDVRTLWYAAQYREERYAATALLTRLTREPALLDVYRELIVDGAWWDHVDELAHRVGELLRAFPEETTPAVAGWRTDPDRWLRRVSIICQVGARERTNRALLVAAVEANVTERDFFLRKAIGWALRDYARTAPDWVREFVATHELSPLSAREAMKHL